MKGSLAELNATFEGKLDGSVLKECLAEKSSLADFKTCVEEKAKAKFGDRFEELTSALKDIFKGAEDEDPSDGTEGEPKNWKQKAKGLNKKKGKLFGGKGRT